MFVFLELLVRNLFFFLCYFFPVLVLAVLFKADHHFQTEARPAQPSQNQPTKARRPSLVSSTFSRSLLFPSTELLTPNSPIPILFLTKEQLPPTSASRHSLFLFKTLFYLFSRLYRRQNRIIGRRMPSRHRPPLFPLVTLVVAPLRRRFFPAPMIP